MSWRVMNKGAAVEGSGFVHGMSYISMIESPPEMFNGDRRFSVQERVVVTLGKEEEEEIREEKKVNPCSSSSSTSSIGKNSDLSSGKSVENSGDTDEVQSPYKGSLDAMEALEEVLPIRRGISRFYNGKSKSFASLADTSSTTSMKDLAKPENAYMRRRRNLLASSLAWDKNRSSLLKSNGGGVSKRVTTTNRTTALALAVTMSSNRSESNNNTKNCSGESLSPHFTPTIAASSLLRGRLNPHLTSPRNNFPAWRSYSLVDLQQCVPVTAACTAAATLDVKPPQT